jgi:hypothetical protein
MAVLKWVFEPIGKIHALLMLATRHILQSLLGLSLAPFEKLSSSLSKSSAETEVNLMNFRQEVFFFFLFGPI